MAVFWFWVIVAIVFAIVEVMTVAFFAAFIALGALGAAIASLLGFNLLVQAIVLGIIGVAGIFVARPYLVARVHVGRPALRSGADSMVGQRAVLLEPIRGAGQPGHVKIAGELWPAITEDGSPLPATTPVIVTDLRSTVLVVRAASLPPASFYSPSSSLPAPSKSSSRATWGLSSASANSIRSGSPA